MRNGKAAGTNRLWLEHWEEVKDHYLKWWKGEGMVFRIHGVGASIPHDRSVEAPEPPAAPAGRHTNPDWSARNSRYALAHMAFLADTIPYAMPDWGTVSLSAFLGANPDFDESTVWYHPVMTSISDHPPLMFDPDQPWWQLEERMVRETVRISTGNYYTACPALTPGLDSLAALRGTEELLFDLVEEPDWVKTRLMEIYKANEEAYERLYQMIAMEDGSSVYSFFHLWSPGRTCQVQCDFAAMISPAMFEEFVVPYMGKQCAKLDHTLFHMDGTQCLRHLDLLLAMDGIDAIQWTPQSGIEQPGDPIWYPLYRKILDAGKSVQAMHVKPDEVLPLLDAVGSKGMFIITDMSDDAEARELIREVDRRR